MTKNLCLTQNSCLNTEYMFNTEFMPLYIILKKKKKKKKKAIPIIFVSDHRFCFLSFVLYVSVSQSLCLSLYGMSVGLSLSV